MTVKDVLQSLVDDGMVDQEKVGTSNYFWAFPSKGINVVSLCAVDMKSSSDCQDTFM